MTRFSAVLASVVVSLASSPGLSASHPSCPAPEPQAGGIFYEVAVPGAEYTSARAINARGDVVGISYAAGAWKGFLLRRGEYRVIDVPGCITPNPTDITNAGVVVGSCYSLPHGSWAGFIWSEKNPPVFFTVPGHPYVTISAINESGVLVGHYSADDELSPVHGFVYRRGSLHTIDYPGVASTEVLDIDAAGNLLVRTNAPEGVSHYVYSRGVFSPLHTCHPGLQPEWRGMTNNGTFAGYLPDAGTGRSAAFLYASTKEQITLVQYPGATFTMFWSATSSGSAVGFAMVPMPEGFSRQVSFVFEPHGRRPKPR
jgi:hypothetical protein